MERCCAKEPEIRHKYREFARKLAKKPNADTGNTNGSDTESARDKQNELEVAEGLEVMSRKPGTEEGSVKLPGIEFMCVAVRSIPTGGTLFRPLACAPSLVRCLLDPHFLYSVQVLSCKQQLSRVHSEKRFVWQMLLLWCNWCVKRAYTERALTT
jgi:hypothetical protein